MSDEEEVYEVSHIVDEDYSNPNQRVFRVRWLGYSAQHDSWEPLENLQNGAMEVVRAWDRKKKQQGQKRKAPGEKSTTTQKRQKLRTSELTDDGPNKSQAATKESSKHGIEAFFQRSSMQTQPGTNGNAPQKKRSAVNGSSTVEIKREEAEEGPSVQLEDNSSSDEEAYIEPGDGAVTSHQKLQYPEAYYTNFLEALDNIKGPPVWVSNVIDSEPCPPLVFTWVEEYQLGEGVPKRDDHFSHGCSCVDCNLDEPQICECLADSDEWKFAYNRDGLIQHPPGIAVIECNDRCECPRTCVNRIVQRGRRMPLELFKTQNKGWGVRTIRPIPKGMFICRYIGEVITEAEAESRGEEYDRKGITYLFDLDFFRDDPDNASDIGSPDPVGNLFSVDAMRYGNVSRFFNHSCQPNVAIYTVVRNGDNRVYDLAIFALRLIKPYEELCFDYKTKKGVKVKQRCYCGEKNCRGWLFGS